MGIISLAQLVQQVDHLPALPQVATKVIRLTDDLNTTPEDLSRVITQDQSLTAKVLKMANSAHYGFPRRIATIKEAVVLLGYNAIRNLVLAASVSRLLESEVEGYTLPRGELWRHSIACAQGARIIAHKVGFRSYELAYITGLLHDIGKVVLKHYMSEAYQQIIEQVKSEEIPFMIAEAQVLGFDHAQVGGLIADKWNLPVELVEAIVYHHNPGQVKQNPYLPAIVHLADALSLMLGVGVGTDGLVYPLDEKAMELLHFDQGLMELVMDQLADSFIEESVIL